RRSRTPARRPPEPGAPRTRALSETSTARGRGSGRGTRRTAERPSTTSSTVLSGPAWFSRLCGLHALDPSCRHSRRAPALPRGSRKGAAGASRARRLASQRERAASLDPLVRVGHRVRHVVPRLADDAVLVDQERAALGDVAEPAVLHLDAERADDVAVE